MKFPNFFACLKNCKKKFFFKKYFSASNPIRTCAACSDRAKNGHFGFLGYPGVPGGYRVPGVGHFGKSTHPIYSRTGRNWFEHDPWTGCRVMLRQLIFRAPRTSPGNHPFLYYGPLTLTPKKTMLSHLPGNISGDSMFWGVRTVKKSGSHP